MKVKNGMIISNLIVYGLAHALVDGVCIGSILLLFFNKVVTNEYLFILIVLYNLIAFGTQPLFGFISDLLKSSKNTAIKGCILVGIGSLVTGIYPIIGVIILGIGNALFHIGGGVVSLNLTPGKATAPGIFVAPGALGLFIGGILTKNGVFDVIYAFIFLLLMSVIIFIVKPPEINFVRKDYTKYELTVVGKIVLLILFSIAIRALIGSVMVFPWKSDLMLAFIFVLLVVLGKSFGGILGDRFGWLKVGVFSLILSIPLLILGGQIAILGLIGIFFFNFTMPITLTVLANIFPGRPGFSFGLTTLALLIGSYPVFLKIQNYFSSDIIVILSIILSALAIYVGLGIYFKYKNKLLEK